MVDWNTVKKIHRFKCFNKLINNITTFTVLPGLYLWSCSTTSSCHISPKTPSPLGSQRGGIVQALPFHHFSNWPIDNWLMVILSYLQRQKLPSLKRRTVKASRVNYMLLKFPFTQPRTIASKQKKSFLLPVLWHCRFGLPCQVQKELDSFFKWCSTKALEWGMVPG